MLGFRDSNRWWPAIYCWEFLLLWEEGSVFSQPDPKLKFQCMHPAFDLHVAELFVVCFVAKVLLTALVVVDISIDNTGSQVFVALHLHDDIVVVSAKKFHGVPLASVEISGRLLSTL